MPGIPRYRGLRQTANRRALLDAVEELLSAHDIASLSVDEIVARAGVAKGTFYNHFADKADIANCIAQDIRREMRDRIAAVKVVSQDPAMHLAIAMTMFLELATKRPNRALILVTMLANATDATSPMNAPVHITLEKGHAASRFRFGSTSTAMVMVLGTVAAGIQYLVKQPVPDPDSTVMELVAHVLCALGIRHSEAGELASGARLHLIGHDEQA